MGVCRSTCGSVSNRGSVWVCVVLHVGLFLWLSLCAGGAIAGAWWIRSVL